MSQTLIICNSLPRRLRHGARWKDYEYKREKC